MRATEQYFCATVYYAETEIEVDEIIFKCDPKGWFFFAIIGIAWDITGVIDWEIIIWSFENLNRDFAWQKSFREMNFN